MIRALPALGGPVCVVFYLALVWLLHHDGDGQSSGKLMLKSSSERRTPLPCAPEKSVGNCTSSKERATCRGPSDTVPTLWGEFHSELLTVIGNV